MLAHRKNIRWFTIGSINNWYLYFRNRCFISFWSVIKSFSLHAFLRYLRDYVSVALNIILISINWGYHITNMQYEHKWQKNCFFFNFSNIIFEWNWMYSNHLNLYGQHLHHEYGNDLKKKTFWPNNTIFRQENAWIQYVTMPHMFTYVFHCIFSPDIITTQSMLG